MSSRARIHHLIMDGRSPIGLRPPSDFGISTISIHPYSSTGTTWYVRTCTRYQPMGYGNTACLWRSRFDLGHRRPPWAEPGPIRAYEYVVPGLSNLLYSFAVILWSLRVPQQRSWNSRGHIQLMYHRSRLRRSSPRVLTPLCHAFVPLLQRGGYAHIH